MTERSRLHIPANLDAPPEVDYGRTVTDDTDSLSRDRIDVRSMTADDVPALARIDRNITGRDSRDYMARKVAESLHDSGIRVSLVAQVDGLPAGYVMARIDFGDYGHTAPVAVIDTIGIDPGHRRHGIGKALLSQLFVNLAALQVERVETNVAEDDLDLLGFLYRCGFRGAQRLVFEKTVA